MARSNARAQEDGDAGPRQSVPLDPGSRYARRVAFYGRYGFGRVGRHGFGNSELAFLRWAIGRGALGGVTADGRRLEGSSWWRAMNADLITVSEHAAALHEGRQRVRGDRATQLWLDYLREPTGLRWYRAHTYTVVESYLRWDHLALREPPGEQALMNEVLYRLLYAQVLVEGASAIGAIGGLIADPRFFAVTLITQLPQLYPRVYPLERPLSERLRVGDRVTRMVAATLDERLFKPGLDALYALVAEVLVVPDLQRLICDRIPIYPHHHPRPREGGPGP